MRPLPLALAFLFTIAPRASASPAGGGKDPANPHGSYVEECGLCHASDSWVPARISSKFNHAKFGFPLEGAHGQASCRSCHQGLDFTKEKPKTSCVSCHQDVHEGEFGADCARCHTARSFIDHLGMVRSHVTTRFPLVGAHAAADCEGCHKPAASGRLSYVNLRTDCESCHLGDYLATTNPDHQAIGFPHDCEPCHATMSWQATTGGFDHSKTNFPLTGAHRTASCRSCHVGGVYQGTSTACAACHQKDYDNTTDPPHQPSGFSTDCATCHSTAGWSGATFDHDGLFFPIYSGPHKGKWTSCSTCHTNPSSYAEFSCFLGCHQHADEANMASKHVGVSGYQYTSTACYTCHPRGTR